MNSGVVRINPSDYVRLKNISKKYGIKLNFLINTILNNTEINVSKLEIRINPVSLRRPV